MGAGALLLGVFGIGWAASMAALAAGKAHIPLVRDERDGHGSAGGALERVRNLCTGWPEVTERLSHGEPSWFHRDRCLFATMADHHHDDRVAVWLAAPRGARDPLIETDPERYFVPPYVGHRGWLGAYLDVEVDWQAVEELIDDAYHTVAGRGR